jgi:predicted nucleotidyltransferase
MISKQAIQQIAKIIVKKYHPDGIILFGSYAYGKPTEDSDLDLIVIKETNLPKHQRAREIRKYLWGLTDVPKDILVYTKKEIADWGNVKQSFITDVMKKGIVLYENKNRSN